MQKISNPKRTVMTKAEMVEQVMQMKKELEYLKTILSLMKENDESKATIKWLNVENDICVKYNCMLGDGNTTYEEWFEYCEDYIGMSNQELEDYKEWLGYDDDEED